MNLEFSLILRFSISFEEEKMQIWDRKAALAKLMLNWSLNKMTIPILRRKWELP